MKYLLTLLLIFPFLSTSAQVKESFINAVDFEIGKEISYEGNLNEGRFLGDLSWAWSSQNACFPKTQKNKFTGKHILFTGIIPAHSITTITLIPKNKKDNLSLYAYQINIGEDLVVPNLPHCITCEADHKWDYNKKGRKKQNHKRMVTNFTAINSSYRLIIGVTGADGLDEADFKIVIETIQYY